MLSSALLVSYQNIFLSLLCSSLLMELNIFSVLEKAFVSHRFHEEGRLLQQWVGQKTSNMSKIFCPFLSFLYLVDPKNKKPYNNRNSI